MIKDISERSRQICNPDMIVKAVGGHVNFILLKCFKSCCSSMCSGKTMRALEI